VIKIIIVIEGADLTGKTTFINELSKRIKNSIKIKLPKVIDLNRNQAQIERLINNAAYVEMDSEKNVVWLVDRFITSALIYSKFQKRETYLSIKDIESKNHLIFILYASENVLRKRYRERKDTFFSIEEILKLNNFFLNFFEENKNRLNGRLFLLRNDNKYDLIKNIKKIEEVVEKWMKKLKK